MLLFLSSQMQGESLGPSLAPCLWSLYSRGWETGAECVLSNETKMGLSGLLGEPDEYIREGCEFN